MVTLSDAFLHDVPRPVRARRGPLEPYLRVLDFLYSSEFLSFPVGQRELKVGVIPQRDSQSQNGTRHRFARIAGFLPFPSQLSPIFDLSLIVQLSGKTLGVYEGRRGWSLVETPFFLVKLVSRYVSPSFLSRLSQPLESFFKTLSPTNISSLRRCHRPGSFSHLCAGLKFFIGTARLPLGVFGPFPPDSVGSFRLFDRARD